MLTGSLGTQAASTLENRGKAVSTQATSRARVRQESSTAKLAKFFPEASPVRIPVRLTRVIEEKCDCSEETVIEFGTHREVLFSSTLPLEFADRLKLKNSDGSLDAEASVVALQYTSGRTAVAARFTQEVSNWIVKP
jgi:hypothetical protein